MREMISSKHFLPCGKKIPAAGAILHKSVLCGGTFVHTVSSKQPVLIATMLLYCDLRFFIYCPMEPHPSSLNMHPFHIYLIRPVFFSKLFYHGYAFYIRCQDQNLARVKKQSDVALRMETGHMPHTRLLQVAETRK